MTEAEVLELAILERVVASAPMTLEDLQQMFHHFSWNQLFVAIDRLSRKGSLTLRRVDRCTYRISLGTQPAAEATDRQFGNTPVLIQS